MAEQQIITIPSFRCINGEIFHDLKISFRIFGNRNRLEERAVLVIHALTGNSQVTGDEGWWNHLIGPGGGVDTEHNAVIAMDLPGNPEHRALGPNQGSFDSFAVADLAQLHLALLQHLGITKLHAVIGASLGALVVWRLAYEKPDIAANYIPIAGYHCSPDWVIAQTAIQDRMLATAMNETDALEVARMWCMLFYRTASSFNQRFSGAEHHDGEGYEVESYLRYQGKKLASRMSVDSYRSVNYLLGSGRKDLKAAESKTFFRKLAGNFLVIGIDSDILFPAAECRRDASQIRRNSTQAQVRYVEINSEIGHDGFLVNNQQLRTAVRQQLAPAPTQPGLSPVYSNIIAAGANPC